MCHTCWTKARRRRLTLHVVERLPALDGLAAEDLPVRQEIPVAEENQPLDSTAGEQNIRFRLPGHYCRAPNSSNCCMVHNCTSTMRLRVPKSLKLQLLIHHNYYVPPSARVCWQHLEDNTWDVLFTAPNRCFDFSPEQVFEMLEWLKQPRNHIIDFENLNETHSSELFYWTGRTQDELERVHNETPSLSQKCRNSRTALGIILSKLRTGESNERLATFFNISRSNLERNMTTARECLTTDFVPRHLGFDHISRDQIIESNLAVPNTLFANNRKAIIICDGTYMYNQKSSNFTFQKLTYSLHKYRNVLKPFLFVTCDGHIIEISGPHAATDNDASILNHHLDGPEKPLHWLLQSGDVLILDRGFRDSLDILESHGYIGIMPQSGTRRATQLSTIDANKSRLCTICRWPVEVVNGRLKREFKIFRQEYCNIAMSHFFADLRIAAALTNAFHVAIVDSPLAHDFINIARDRLHVNNNLADYIDTKRLNRNRVFFESITVVQQNVTAFPLLTPDDLSRFAVGTYQIKLAPSYYSEQIRISGSFNIHKYNRDLTDLLSAFNMPFNNVQLLRMHIRSRHKSNRYYYCYILIDEDNSDSGLESIKNYCCSCYMGRRTIGCCAHLMCLIWFLGWARHQDFIRCPALFLDTIILD